MTNTSTTPVPHAPFRRRVRVGTVDTGYASRASVVVDVEWSGTGLSFSGSARRPGARDIDLGGQIIDVVEEVEVEALDVSPADRDRLVDYWRRWHLNDCRAGCEHQRAEGWGERPIDPSRPTNTYGRHFPGQTYPSWNLLGWVRRDEHPEGLLAEPCPTCGYRYGTAWLTEEVPADVLEWLSGVGVAR